MNLTNILYQPYVIIIVLSLIITLIAYFILINDKKEENKNNNSKTLLYTFIISFLTLTILRYAIHYMNKNNFFQKGGVTNPTDRLTIIADDVDFDIIDE